VSRPDRLRRFELDRPAERIPTGHPQQHPSASRRTHVSRDGGRVQRATDGRLGSRFIFGQVGRSGPVLVPSRFHTSDNAIEPVSGQYAYSVSTATCDDVLLIYAPLFKYGSVEIIK
jgi:hypothetical protein